MYWCTAECTVDACAQRPTRAQKMTWVIIYSTRVWLRWPCFYTITVPLSSDGLTLHSLVYIRASMRVVRAQCTVQNTLTNIKNVPKIESFIFYKCSFLGRRWNKSKIVLNLRQFTWKMYTPTCTLNQINENVLFFVRYKTICAQISCLRD